MLEGAFFVAALHILLHLALINIPWQLEKNLFDYVANVSTTPYEPC
jgi:hypothetical protein